jgi:hypothetical protein
MNTQNLIQRLDDIGHSLERSGHALALIGLGSVGLELDRLDSYSDLDFFVIAEPGYKRAYLESLHWLRDIHPIAYCFLNTNDGYKVLYEDGIFCEFAVFEPADLEKVLYSPGRTIWKRENVSDSFDQPVNAPLGRTKRSEEFLLGEALTNLYVGLNRDQRGEKLTALRFIQVYAVDRLLELAETIEPATEVPYDPFVNERRFEQRHPVLIPWLSQWTQGYEKNRESALAILDFLEQHFEVNPSIAEAIRDLSKGA